LFSFSPFADQDFAKCLNLEKEEGIVFECSEKTISRVKGELNKLQTEKDQSKVPLWKKKECAFIDLGDISHQYPLDKHQGCTDHKSTV
jgi:hypothetical protein